LNVTAPDRDIAWTFRIFELNARLIGRMAEIDVAAGGQYGRDGPLSIRFSRTPARV
jgi:hypothetical protein